MYIISRLTIWHWITSFGALPWGRLFFLFSEFLRVDTPWYFPLACELVYWCHYCSFIKKHTHTYIIHKQEKEKKTEIGENKDKIHRDDPLFTEGQLKVICSHTQL